MMFPPGMGRVLLLASLLSVSFFAIQPVTVAQDDSEDAHFVGWSPGDSWVWKKDPTSAKGSRSEGNLTWKVGPYGTTEMAFWESTDPVTWRTHDTVRVQTWLNTTIPTEETTIEIKQRIDMDRRVEDHALAYSFVDDRYDIILPNGTSQGKHTERQVERFSPLVELRFPFAVGDAWRAHADQRYVRVNSDECGNPGQPTCRGGSSVVYTYEVVGRDKLTLQVNGELETMNTWRIKVSDESTTDGRTEPMYEIWWYADEACNVVKREQYSSGRTKLGVFTLTDFKCARTHEQDPSYDIYGFGDLSSTRVDGRLNDDVLREVRREQQRQSTLWAPGPGVAWMLMVAALGLALVARRR